MMRRDTGRICDEMSGVGPGLSMCRDGFRTNRHIPTHTPPFVPSSAAPIHATRSPTDVSHHPPHVSAPHHASWPPHQVSRPPTMRLSPLRLTHATFIVSQWPPCPTDMSQPPPTCHTPPPPLMCHTPHQHVMPCLRPHLRPSHTPTHATCLPSLACHPCVLAPFGISQPPPHVLHRCTPFSGPFVCPGPLLPWYTAPCATCMSPLRCCTWRAGRMTWRCSRAGAASLTCKE